MRIEGVLKQKLLRARCEAAIRPGDPVLLWNTELDDFNVASGRDGAKHLCQRWKVQVENQSLVFVSQEVVVQVGSLSGKKNGDGIKTSR